jgi:3-methylfumaryl-CoA hydratase
LDVSEPAVDIDALRAWIGRQEVRQDVITLGPVTGLSATLDYPGPLAEAGEPLPPGWHWLYFLPTAPSAELGEDGHPRRGGFLPLVPLPRRMWAGSAVRFHDELCVGDVVRRVSTVDDVIYKRGASGELVFVKVRHEVFRAEQCVIEEQQDLVYRAASPVPAIPAKPAPGVATWSRELQPDPVMLFRFSALTFNAHRIHYDRDYARDSEGYPGLVVQGPFTVMLLLDLLRRETPGVRIASFSFRALRPLFDLSPLYLQGRPDGDSAQLWALDSDGALAMELGAILA